MKLRSICILLVTATAAVLATTSAYAQATRTWVSGVGDDVNPCSRTAPCKTFAGAISKTAAGGEITVLDPGGFGAVTITKSITLNGGGIRGGILDSGTTGVIINITNPSDAGVVVLHGLDIQGGGSGTNGIRFISGQQLHIRDCTITGHTTHGISVTAPNAAAFVVNTTISRNGGSGVFVLPTSGTATVALDKVTTSDNAQTGIRGEAGARITARECSSFANNNGFVAVGSTGASDMNVDNCIASGNNSFGIASVGASGIIRIKDNVVTHNGTGLAGISGGALLSYLPNASNRVGGNGVDGAPTANVAAQ